MNRTFAANFARPSLLFANRNLNNLAGQKIATCQESAMCRFGDTFSNLDPIVQLTNVDIIQIQVRRISIP